VRNKVIDMNKTKTTFIVLIAVTLLASGCMSDTQEPQPDQEEPADTNLTANQWCQQNNNGEAVRNGCMNQSQLLEADGEFYYGADHEEINCADEEAYVCTQ
jgi:hypothetical protein